MTTPILFALTFGPCALRADFGGQGAAVPSSPSAASLISKMFVKYVGAKTLSGTVKMTQSADNVSVVADTRLAYERPSKIRLDQTRNGSEARKTTLVSDGTLFAYTPPPQIVSKSPFLVERVKPDDRRPSQTIGDMYAIVASDLPDRSAVLDTLIARIEDLSYVKDQFKQFVLVGPGKVGDRDVQIIRGTWQEFADGPGKHNRPLTGDFELCLTSDGDLVRYTLKQTFGAPLPRDARGVPQPTQAVGVTTVWDVNVKVNEPIPEGTFAMKSR